MTTIIDLLARQWCLSVELWPPRTEAAALHLTETLDRLDQLHPAFASITYGAGGSTRDRTHDLVVQIEREQKMTPMAHLACAAHRRSELVSILQRYLEAGVENILALRGDPPLESDEALAPGDLEHAIDLVELAKSVGPFCVAVAAHPEGHPDAPDLATDRRRLAEKLAVADFAITQFFFRPEDYFSLVDDVRALGVDKPIIPGVMPITNLRTVKKMAELSGCPVPASILERVEAVANDADEVRKIGVEIASTLCQTLLDNNVPGLHFYTLNQVSATIDVCENLGLLSN